jgi:uncharacterized protein YndB with AHSA1/START domain
VFDIRHRVGISAPTDRVYELVATRSGLAEFWATQVEGDAAVGGKLTFYFNGPKPSAVMEVLELSPGQRVEWRCIDGPAEWVDTTVTFDFKATDAETVLLFTHAGWREPVEFMHHCSTKWATFLLGLKSGLEGGAFTAHPNDTRISSSWG